MITRWHKRLLTPLLKPVSVNPNFQMFKLVSERAEEPEIKLPTSIGSSKKQESSRKNMYFCFTD